MPLRRHRAFLSILFIAGLATVLLKESSLLRVEREEVPREFSLKAQDWMNRLRGRPYQRTVAAARLEAIRKRDAMAARLRAHPEAAGPINPNAAWMSIGPQPAQDSAFGIAGGRATAIAVDPTNDSAVFVGTSGGGVWGSKDGGQTWSPLTDFQSSLAIGSLAIDPTNHLTIYAGTGEQEDFVGDAYYGAGVLKSTDGGTTWTLISGSNNGMQEASIGSIAVNPLQSNVVLATQVGGSNPGVVLSTDGGATWVSSLPLSSGQYATSVIFDPLGNAYAGISSCTGCTAPTNSIVKCANSSGCNPSTWVGVIGSLPAYRIEMAIAPQNPNFIYALVTSNVDNRHLDGLLVTDNGFATSCTTGCGYYSASSYAPLDFCAPQCYYNLTLAVDPTNATHLFAGGSWSGYQNSGYSGANQLVSIQFAPDPITQITSTTPITQGSDGVSPHPDFHGIAISQDGQKFYTANDGGVWQLNNYNSNSFTWTSLSGTLDTIEFYHLSLDATNLANGFGGAQDNGILHYSGNLAWQEPTTVCGDGGSSAIDFSNPNNVYIGCDFYGSSFASTIISKSVDGGNTFNAAEQGINLTDTSTAVPALVMDPSNSATLYFGTNHIYQTQNGASSWSQISACDFGDPTCLNPSSGDTIYSITVASQDSNTVWVGTLQGLLWVSHNATSTSPTFTPLPIPNATNPLTGYSNAVTGIAIDPNNVNDVFVSLSGFAGSRVLNTQDGTTFVDATGGLPAIPINSIVFDPDLASTLYVGTDVGAFYTTNGGTTWQPLGVNLPNVAIRSLAFHHSSRTLRAATNGRGMWQISVGGTADFTVAAGALSPASVSAGASATSTITVASVNGFNSAVALTCSVSPVVTLGPTCSFSPASVTLGSSQVTSTLTVNTTAATVRALLGKPPRWKFFYAAGFLLTTLVLSTMWISQERRRQAMSVILLGMVVAALSLLIACGGGGSSGSNGGGGNPGTPAGQYTITIGGGAGSITHQQTLTLTVQ